MEEDTQSETEGNNVHDDFKIAVKNYISLSDEIDEIQRSTKDKRKKLKSLTEFILGYMQEQKKEVCNLGESGALVVKQSKTKKVINKEYLQELSEKYLKNETAAKEYTEYIFENQQVNYTAKLHRSKLTD
jgi:hypothetical protein